MWKYFEKSIESNKAKCVDKPRRFGTIEGYYVNEGSKEKIFVSALLYLLSYGACADVCYNARLSSLCTAMKPKLADLKIMKTTTGEKIKIVESVAPQWKELGDLLDFDPEGRTLELIEANNQQKGPVACCREMLVTWLKGKGREATWEVLIELLEDIDQSELAKMVKTALH